MRNARGGGETAPGVPDGVPPPGKVVRIFVKLKLSKEAATVGEPQDVHVTVAFKSRPKHRHRAWDIAAIILACGLITVASGNSEVLFCVLAAVFLSLYVVSEVVIAAKRRPTRDPSLK